MSTTKTIEITSKGFIIFSLFGLSAVAILSMADPQATMDLVAVQLGNNGARSSIRGVYGGVGLTILTFSAIYFKTRGREILMFLSLFWTYYAFARLLTVFMDGALGGFGSRWLVIESVMAIAGWAIFYLQKRMLQANT